MRRMVTLSAVLVLSVIVPRGTAQTAPAFASVVDEYLDRFAS